MVGNGQNPKRNQMYSKTQMDIMNIYISTLVDILTLQYIPMFSIVSIMSFILFIYLFIIFIIIIIIIIIIRLLQCGRDIYIMHQ